MKFWNKKIKILELFGGIGSGRKSYQTINKDIEWEYVDNNNSAVSAYNHIFKTNHEPIDIKNYQGNYKEFDGIIAGFPCQDVSQAGKNNVKKGKRTILYKEMLRVINEIQPNWVILENVKGLLQKKHEKHYRFIVNYLIEWGFLVTKLILSPLQFGIPQSRPRLFIIARKQKNLLLKLTNLQNRFDLHPPLSEFLDDEPYQNQVSMWKETKNYYIIPRKKDDKLISGSYNRVWKVDKVVGTIAVSNQSKIGYKKNKLYYRHLTINEMVKLMGWTEKRDLNYFNSLPKSRAQKLLGNAICLPILRELLKIVLE